MDLACKYAPLVNARRLLLKHVPTSKWYAVLGIMSQACVLGASCHRFVTEDGREYWKLNVDSDSETWCVLAIVDLDQWKGARFYWSAPLDQYCDPPVGRMSVATGGCIVIRVEQPLDSLIRTAARCAFHDLGHGDVVALATAIEIEVPREGSLFNVLWSLIQRVLECTDAAVLEILRSRLIKEKKPRANKFADFGDLADVFTMEEKKAFKKLQEEEEKEKKTRKTFLSKWVAKKKEVRDAAAAAAGARAPAQKGRGRGRRGKAGNGAEPPHDDIDLVRAQRRASLPDGSLEQVALARLCPPRTHIWNNWRQGAWRIVMAGYPGDTESWAEHGRTEAGLVLLARWCRQWLEDSSLTEADCPHAGLLEAR